MNTRMRRTAIAVVTAAMLPLSLAACGSDDADTTNDTAQEETGTDAAGADGTEEDTEEPAEDTATDMDEGMAGAAAPFGPACAAIPEEGAGSFDEMAEQPVATAASDNPELSTLVTALTEAGLVDTLNGAEDITVFAPINEAFEAIPEEDLDALLADQEQLTAVLTYHVVGERLAPEDLEDGTYETLQGGEITVSGADEEYTVNDANVVCGNVRTENATVYLIDQVLMP
ncbi:fasciclin domain-containing protein [Streptomyces calidiresistens]|uniref:Fasciclin domain-containing protein n=1 Tax=Streptomyces calidiresistens TaxID=1485586 RepID=A0A7W3T654_9ACTN|nr:fasciclin domain-containing protein [Streptomyces calidiresistens]MBB0231647.1 fasciclin domain-containing protein [Streptomyces calidiresistens]